MEGLSIDYGASKNDAVTSVAMSKLAPPFGDGNNYISVHRRTSLLLVKPDSLRSLSKHGRHTCDIRSVRTEALAATTVALGWLFYGYASSH